VQFWPQGTRCHGSFLPLSACEMGVSCVPHSEQVCVANKRHASLRPQKGACTCVRAAPRLHLHSLPLLGAPKLGHCCFKFCVGPVLVTAAGVIYFIPCSAVRRPSNVCWRVWFCLCKRAALLLAGPPSSVRCVLHMSCPPPTVLSVWGFAASLAMTTVQPLRSVRVLGYDEAVTVCGSACLGTLAPQTQLPQL
jgi:hypothetical protein